MISLSQVQTYARFNGDIDDLQRRGSALEKAAFPGNSWSTIELILHLLRNARAGNGDHGLESRIATLRADQFSDPQAWETLLRLA